jgi:hypothetical protein
MYILTAKVDKNSQNLLNHLRAEYFPAHRNFLDAHLTLFSHYPVFDLSNPYFSHLLPEKKMSVSFEQVFYTGMGFAVEVKSPELEVLRSQMLSLLRPAAPGVESSTNKLHVTIQSEVDPRRAINSFEAFSKTWAPVLGEIEGIEVWRPLSGPWGFVGGYRFMK